MDARWKKYLTLHAVLLAVAAGFGVYAVLTSLLLPDGFFHCIMHDLLHLYCPFCGGTRAFLAFLRLDILSALRLNSAVLLAALVFLVVDVRALVLLCRRSKRALLPPHLGDAAILLFSVYTLVLNTLMLYGLDPVGDLAVYWQEYGTPLGAVLFLPVGVLLLLSFWIAIDVFRIGRLARLRRVAAWLSGYLSVTLLCVLYARWCVYLLFVPLTVGHGICLLVRYKKRKS